MQERQEVQPATGIFTLLAWLLVAILLSAAVLLLAGAALERLGAPARWRLRWRPSFSAPRCSSRRRHSADERAFTYDLFTWVPVADQAVPGTQIDQLSIVFVLLITGVGSLIHIYSVGYGLHPERRRFFAFMNLFVAAMLLLVVANDYLVVYVGWEGVGLASYSLIGFWYYKPSAATAAKKAFRRQPCR